MSVIQRVIAAHISKYIPGNPKVVVENMPGASGRVGANWAYTVAPKDGSLMMGLLQTHAMGQAIGEGGVRYDARGFFAHTHGRGDFMTNYVLEVAPSSKTRPLKHLYEVLVYTLSGYGSTIIWFPDGRKRHL